MAELFRLVNYSNLPRCDLDPEEWNDLIATIFGSTTEAPCLGLSLTLWGCILMYIVCSLASIDDINSSYQLKQRI